MPRGRGFLGSQPRLGSFPATHLCSRAICLHDVGANTTMPRKSEARPRGQTHPVKPDPEAQGRPRRWTQLTQEHNGLGGSFNTTGTVTPVTLTPGMTLGGHMPPLCLSLLTWRMKVMGVKL